MIPELFKKILSRTPAGKFPVFHQKEVRHVRHSIQNQPSLELLKTAESGKTYLTEQDRLVSWAHFNRRLAAKAILSLLGCEGGEVLDTVHNSIERTDTGFWLHRKGAAEVRSGKPVLIAGTPRIALLSCCTEKRFRKNAILSGTRSGTQMDSSEHPFPDSRKIPGRGTLPHLHRLPRALPGQESSP